MKTCAVGTATRFSVTYFTTVVLSVATAAASAAATIVSSFDGQVSQMVVTLETYLLKELIAE